MPSLSSGRDEPTSTRRTQVCLRSVRVCTPVSFSAHPERMSPAAPQHAPCPCSCSSTVSCLPGTATSPSGSPFTSTHDAPPEAPPKILPATAVMWCQHTTNSSGAQSVLRAETAFRARQHTRVRRTSFMLAFVASSLQDDRIELGPWSMSLERHGASRYAWSNAQHAGSDAPLGRLSASRPPCASQSPRPKWAWPCLHVKTGRLRSVQAV